MSGEMDLDCLIASMEPVLAAETYVFSTTTNADIVRQANARMIFEEAEGITLILQQAEAERLHLGSEFPCRMITLNIHSSLEAVGFIACIATHLSKYGMGVNPVAGFYHDHLFVPVDKADAAMAALTDLVASTTSSDN